MAGHSVALCNALVDAAGINSNAWYFAAFDGDPDSGGAEISGGSYARVQAKPPAAANRTVTYPTAELLIPQLAAGKKVFYWAVFTTLSGGTPFDSGQVNGTTGVSFDVSGRLRLTLTRTGPA